VNRHFFNSGFYNKIIGGKIDKIDGMSKTDINLMILNSNSKLIFKNLYLKKNDKYVSS